MISIFYTSIQFTVNDIDSGINGQYDVIIASVESMKTSTGTGNVPIMPKVTLSSSGALQLTAPLDKEAGDQYRIVVRATDRGKIITSLKRYDKVNFRSLAEQGAGNIARLPCRSTIAGEMRLG